MQKRRVHFVNSESAKPSIRFSVIVSAVLGACSFGSFHAQGQQPSDTSPIYDNPFRVVAAPANPAAINALAPNPDTERKEPTTILESPIESVVYLEKLPSQTDRPVVTAISVSPDSELIAAAGDDHAIRLVSMKSGKTISTLQGHVDWVQAVEFSADGKRLASCGNDGQLKIWSIDSEPKLVATHRVGHALQTLAFLGNEEIFTAGFGNNLYRLHINNAAINVFHACECSDIRSIACSPDLQWVAFGGRDGVLRIRTTQVESASQAAALPPQNGHADTAEHTANLHSDRIRSIQFSSDGQQITSVGEDRRIVHYDLALRKPFGQTEIGGGKLMGLCQLEPNLFAIAGADNTIRIFSDMNHRVLVKLVGHDGSVTVLKKTPRYIVSGSYDTTIRIWDIDRAISSTDSQGLYKHPVAAQFEDSGAGDQIK
jgi:WD40 repeat protein